MLLGKADIVECEDLISEDVEVPEWGGVLRVRQMNAMDRDSFDLYVVRLKSDGKSAEVNKHNLRAALVVRSVIDEEGKRIFSDEDVETVGMKNGQAVDRVFAVASRLSLLGKDDAADIEKNS